VTYSPRGAIRKFRNLAIKINILYIISHVLSFFDIFSYNINAFFQKTAAVLKIKPSADVGHMH